MNFQTILMPKVNLAKILSEKSWSVRTIPMQKYALVNRNRQLITAKNTRNIKSVACENILVFNEFFKS